MNLQLRFHPPLWFSPLVVTDCSSTADVILILLFIWNLAVVLRFTAACLTSSWWTREYKYPSFFLPPLPPLALRCFLPFLLLFFHPPLLFLLLAFVLFLIVVFKNAPAQLEMSFGKIIVIRLKITTTGRKKTCLVK